MKCVFDDMDVGDEVTLTIDTHITCRAFFKYFVKMTVPPYSYAIIVEDRDNALHVFETRRVKVLAISKRKQSSS